MNYENPALAARLAAEYVVGTLRGRARRRFERLVGASLVLQSRVAYWDGHLGALPLPLDSAVEEPPAEVRAALMLRIATGGLPLKSSPPTDSRHRRRRVRWLAPYFAGFATAAMLVVAIGMALHGTRARPTTSSGVGTLLPIYAAEVGIPESSMQWLLSVSPDHRSLDVVAAEDFLQLGRHSVQLWCAVPGGSPVPLGVLPVDRNGTASFEIPMALRGQPQVSFIISLESEGGPRSTRPSDSVLSATPALDGI